MCLHTDFRKHKEASRNELHAKRDIAIRYNFTAFFPVFLSIIQYVVWIMKDVYVRYTRRADLLAVGEKFWVAVFLAIRSSTLTLFTITASRRVQWTVAMHTAAAQNLWVTNGMQIHVIVSGSLTCYLGRGTARGLTTLVWNTTWRYSHLLIFPFPYAFEYSAAFCHLIRRLRQPSKAFGKCNECTSEMLRPREISHLHIVAVYQETVYLGAPSISSPFNNCTAHQRGCVVFANLVDIVVAE